MVQHAAHHDTSFVGEVEAAMVYGASTIAVSAHDAFSVLCYISLFEDPDKRSLTCHPLVYDECNHLSRTRTLQRSL